MVREMGQGQGVFLTPAGTTMCGGLLRTTMTGPPVRTSRSSACCAPPGRRLSALLPSFRLLIPRPSSSVAKETTASIFESISTPPSAGSVAWYTAALLTGMPRSRAPAMSASCPHECLPPVQGYRWAWGLLSPPYTTLARVWHT